MDFESLLLGESANTVDPESMIKTFHQERLSNGELLRLTQNPVADKNPEEFEEEPSVRFLLFIHDFLIYCSYS